MLPAYAIAVTEENLKGVIRSEAGPKFDLETALWWLEEHGEGWFLRDPNSPLDCQFFMPEVFFEMYSFWSNDPTSLIRRVVQN
jgi:hypothetical protein